MEKLTDLSAELKVWKKYLFSNDGFIVLIIDIYDIPFQGWGHWLLFIMILFFKTEVVKKNVSNVLIQQKMKS